MKKEKLDKLYGVDLNKKAWESSFEERNQSPIFLDPREGYWGSKTHPKKKDSFLRWKERNINILHRVNVDVDGFQYVECDSHIPEYTILIIGGSVAYGAYASSEKNTYFSKLADFLEERQIYVKIFILAAGSWVSYDELVAFEKYGLDKSPDIVIFFNGLNDLTNIDTKFQERVSEYLLNMRGARYIAKNNNIISIFALQPFLPWKKKHTDIEKQILKLSTGSAGVSDWISGDNLILPNNYAYKLAPFYENTKQELKLLDDGKESFFIDCSGVFNDEQCTTFTDLWHFSDPGHLLVAEIFFNKLFRIINKK
jgi:hypothetical protein